MGFWIFMFAVNLLIPLVMVIFGAIFIKTAPKKINFLFGYRTERSMKNEDTWKFAHTYLGKLWLIIGAAMLLVSAVVMFLIMRASETVVSAVGTGLCFLELAGLVAPIFPTESALEKTFDKNGNRK